MSTYTLTIPAGRGVTVAVHADTVEQLLAAATALDVADLSTLAPTTGSTTTAPAGQAPTCAHGARVHRTGTSKTTGEPWAAWFCPTPKDAADKCPPIFESTRGTAPAPAAAVGHEPAPF